MKLLKIDPLNYEVKEEFEKLLLEEEPVAQKVEMVSDEGALETPELEIESTDIELEDIWETMEEEVPTEVSDQESVAEVEAEDSFAVEEGETLEDIWEAIEEEIPTEVSDQESITEVGDEEDISAVEESEALEETLEGLETTDEESEFGDVTEDIEIDEGIGGSVGEELVEEPEEDFENSIATVTLAEIYAAQGFVKRAIDMLEKVLEREPDRENVRNRLEELRVEISLEEGGESGDKG